MQQAWILLLRVFKDLEIFWKTKINNNNSPLSVYFQSDEGLFILYKKTLTDIKFPVCEPFLLFWALSLQIRTSY